MKRLVHIFASWFLKRRIEQIEQFMRYPQEVQLIHFKQLMERTRDTEWGKIHGYADIYRVEQFQERVPIHTYESFYPYIERCIQGEKDLIWPGQIKWYAKSSGTTNDKSKFIPVTEESLQECHFKAGQDMLGMYFHNYPESKLFTGKSLSIGGSHHPSAINPEARVGDVSAVLLENLPKFYDLMRAPSKEVALLPNWDEKIEAMVEELLYEDITAIAGVPTWTLLLIHRMIESGELEEKDIRRIWPNLEVYFHGGVNFEPYRESFREVIPHADMNYVEVYNASEGYFGMQDSPGRQDMLLMLDYGIFYEFVPLHELDKEHPRAYTLSEVELHKQYAMVITTNGGLCRYLIGDTVTFTSKYPYRIRITGRTKQFINAFGEELIVENAEQAMVHACQMTGAVVDNFTAAPIYLAGKQRGGHEWLIEFKKQPGSMDRFTHFLDEELKKLNTDYQAKRVGDLALGLPLVRPLPVGTFYEWMRKRGKLGGQHKVPRLANNREYVEDILSMLSVNS